MGISTCRDSQRSEKPQLKILYRTFHQQNYLLNKKLILDS